MDLLILSQLAAQAMRLYADHMELAATGTHTPEQSKAISASLRAHIDALQALTPKA